MRHALEQVIEIVTDARGGSDMQLLPVSIYLGIKDFKVLQRSPFRDIFFFFGEGASCGRGEQ